MENISSHSFASCARTWSGRVFCDAEVERAAVVDGAEEDFSTEAVKAEDLLVKERAAEDDESSMEEPEAKLGGEELSEKGEPVGEAGRGGLLDAGWQNAFLSFLTGIAFGLWLRSSAFRLVVTFLGIVWFSSKAVLEKTEVERWKRCGWKKVWNAVLKYTVVVAWNLVKFKLIWGIQRCDSKVLSAKIILQDFGSLIVPGLSDVPLPKFT
jgi:hypothetical protein